MPVLEDGLSSGHASDTDNNNPTIVLIKCQVPNTEEELNQSIDKNIQILSKPVENGLSPTGTVVDIGNPCSGYEDVLSQSESLGSFYNMLFTNCFTYYAIISRKNTTTSCTCTS